VNAGEKSPPRRGVSPRGRTPLREERNVNETTKRTRWSRNLALLAIATLGFVALAGDAQAGPRNKMDRQIRLMERILDDMLVESPNWLVRSSHEARGSYDDGEGVLFTFDADLVHSGYGKKFWKWNWWGDDIRIEIDDDDYDDDDRDRRRDRREERKRMEERSLRKQERLYNRGKTEIVETLLDFGDALTVLGDDEWVTVEVYLDDADYFYEKDLRRLTVKAKMADLRAYAEEKLSEEDAVKRIQIEEK
jgi:hypothetical protein